MALDTRIENILDAFMNKHDTRATVHASAGSFWSLCGLGDGSFAAETRSVLSLPNNRAICRILNKYALKLPTQTVAQIDVPAPPPSADYSVKNKEVRDFLEV